MADATVGKLRVTVTADTRGVTGKILKIKEDLTNMSTHMNTVANKFDGNFKKIGTSLEILKTQFSKFSTASKNSFQAKGMTTSIEVIRKETSKLASEFARLDKSFKVGGLTKFIQNLDLLAIRVTLLANKFGQLTNAIEKTSKFKDFSTDVRKTNTSLGQLNKRMTSVSKSTATASTRVAKASTRMDKLNKSSKKSSLSMKNLSKNFKKAGKDIDKAGRSFERMGRFAAKATMAISALAIGASIKMATMASSATELDNILLQVFGDEGRTEMKNWAKSLSGEVGRANYQMKEMVGRYGAILNAQGFTDTQTKKLSKSLTALTVDMGSLWEKADEDVFGDMLSGLTGQVRAMRKYGVSIEDAMLKQEAANLGVEKSVENMTQQEKIMLRYNLILKQTKTSQGDAVRTIANYANQVKMAKGQIDDLARSIGEFLLPTFTKIITKINDFLRALKEIDINEIFSNEKLKQVTKTALGFTGVALGIGLVGTALRLLKNPFFKILSLSGIIVIGMEKNFFGLRDNILDAFASIQEFFLAMVNNIKDSDIFRFFKTSLLNKDIQSQITKLKAASGELIGATSGGITVGKIGLLDAETMGNRLTEVKTELADLEKAGLINFNNISLAANEALKDVKFPNLETKTIAVYKEEMKLITAELQKIQSFAEGKNDPFKLKELEANDFKKAKDQIKANIEDVKDMFDQGIISKALYDFALSGGEAIGGTLIKEISKAAPAVRDILKSFFEDLGIEIEVKAKEDKYQSARNAFEEMGMDSRIILGDVTPYSSSDFGKDSFDKGGSSKETKQYEKEYAAYYKKLEASQEKSKKEIEAFKTNFTEFAGIIGDFAGIDLGGIATGVFGVLDGFDAMSNATSSFGKLAGGLGVASAGIGIVTSLLSMAGGKSNEEKLASAMERFAQSLEDSKIIELTDNMKNFAKGTELIANLDPDDFLMGKQKIQWLDSGLEEIFQSLKIDTDAAFGSIDDITEYFVTANEEAVTELNSRLGIALSDFQSNFKSALMSPVDEFSDNFDAVLKNMELEALTTSQLDKSESLSNLQGLMSDALLDGVITNTERSGIDVAEALFKDESQTFNSLISSLGLLDDEVDSLTSSLTNVPSIFKIAERVFGADQGIVSNVASGTTATSIVNNITVPIGSNNIIGVDDINKKIEDGATAVIAKNFSELTGGVYE